MNDSLRWIDEAGRTGRPATSEHLIIGGRLRHTDDIPTPNELAADENQEDDE